MTHCIDGEPTGDRYVDAWPAESRPLPRPVVRCRECSEVLDDGTCDYPEHLRCSSCMNAEAWMHAAY